jgi:parallel beta-helix repeat protein
MKRIIPILCIISLISTTNCAIFGFRPKAQVVKGTIARDTVWQGSVLITKDVLVLPGVKLVVKPGTVVSFKKSASTRTDPRFLFPSNELIIRGVLLAEGTPEEPIVFTSAEEQPQMEDWAGIILDGAGSDTSLVKHCRIEFAETGIYCISSSPRLKQNQLSQNKYGIVCQKGSLPFIQQNEISAGEVGIACWDSSAPKITDNHIFDNQQAGILWGVGATPWFENNLIEGNQYGIYGGEEYTWTTNRIQNNEHDFYLSPQETEPN